MNLNNYWYFLRSSVHCQVVLMDLQRRSEAFMKSLDPFSVSHATKALPSKMDSKDMWIWFMNKHGPINVHIVLINLKQHLISTAIWFQFIQKSSPKTRVDRISKSKHTWYRTTSISVLSHQKNINKWQLVYSRPSGSSDTLYSKISWMQKTFLLYFVLSYENIPKQLSLQFIYSRAWE